MADVKFRIKASNDTKKALDSVRKGLGGITSTVFSLKGAIGGAIGVGGFGALIKSAASAADANAKLSDRLGIATKDLAAFQLQGKLSGASNEAITTSLEKMSKNIGDAAQGFGQAGTLMRAMNINVEELARMNPAEQYKTIADKIRNLDSQSKQVSATMAIFGRSGSAMLNMIQAGPEAFDKAKTEAEAYGLALDRVDSAKIEAANDAMTRAQSVASGIGTTFAVQLAPYIEEFADDFASLAVEHDGFKDEIINGIESVAHGVAYLGNVYRGLEVVWKGLGVVFDGFIANGIEHLAEWDDAISALIDKIPGLEATPDPKLQQWAADARKEFEDSSAALEHLVMQPMPTEQIDAFFAKVKEDAQQSAEAAAKSKRQIAASFQDNSSDTQGASDAELKKLNEYLNTKVDAISQSLLTEQEREQQSYELRQLQLEEWRARGLDTEHRYNQISEKLEYRHQKSMHKITGKSQNEIFKGTFKSYSAIAKMSDAFRAYDLKSALFYGAQALQVSATQNEKLFKIQKILALANAAVNLPSAVIQSYERAGGYPWGIAAAAAMAAEGAAQIQAISSTSFGGGKGAKMPSGGGGGSALPSLGGGNASANPYPSFQDAIPVEITNQANQAAANQPTTVNVTLDGIVDKNGLRSLADQLNELYADGYKLNFN